MRLITELNPRTNASRTHYRKWNSTGDLSHWQSEDPSNYAYQHFSPSAKHVITSEVTAHECTMRLITELNPRTNASRTHYRKWNSTGDLSHWQSEDPSNYAYQHPSPSAKRVITSDVSERERTTRLITELNLRTNASWTHYRKWNSTGDLSYWQSEDPSNYAYQHFSPSAKHVITSENT